MRFFALKDSYNNFPSHTGIAKFLDEYLEKKNKEMNSSDVKDLLLVEYYNDFISMLTVVKKYFKHGFSKNQAPQVSRVFFEAISVGVHLALKENPNFETTQENVSKWLDSKEFKQNISGKYHTHIPRRIKERIEFVKNKLINNE